MMNTYFKFGFNTFTLKLIAIITMIIDHVGAVFFNHPDYMYIRMIGRLSFPIFAFLLVEGFVHSKNIYKYMIRLFAFALISEPAFDLAFYGSLNYVKAQNIFFTLFIGLVMIYFVEKNTNETTKLVIVLAAMVVASILMTDYDYAGIMLIYFLYRFRDNPVGIFLSMLFVNGLVIGGIQIFGVVAVIPMLFYNGKKGFGGFKYLFYLIYPLHLIILWFIKNNA